VSQLDPVLLRGLSAIEPYLGDVVVAGGWVPHIYELLYDAAAAGRSPRTRDIDLAVRRSVAVRDKSIDRLLAEAGFTCEFHSLDTPPVTKYVAGSDDGEVEIEFITDAPGSSEATVYVQPDLTAQELHYVGLLLDNPWAVDFDALTGGEVAYTALIPKPAVLVFHKALVFKNRRDRLKREKDLYYVFFVIDTFPRWRAEMTADLARLAAQKPVWFKKFRQNLESVFESPDADGVEALLNQKPPTAYPGMSDDQFRQYAFSTMTELIGIMDAAGSR
jgi:hypothetical protein